MRIIRHPQKGKLYRPVVALGTFDGAHLGHRKIIEAAVSYAREIGAHSAVITFDPHPQEIVSPQRGLRLLTTLPEREALFRGLGADAVVVFSFSPSFQKLSSAEFIKRYLVKKLGVRRVFVGYDFAFGEKRSGNTVRLKKLGAKYGFGVTVIPPVKIFHHFVKSGRIRELLSNGNFAAALALLGHPYRLTGKVVRGAGRGRQLGFSTANLKVDPRKLIPFQGVYVGFIDGKKCVVNIGSRPTFGAGQSQIEAHILNFNGNLLGKTLALDLFFYLREEKQFSDVEGLKLQIKKDIARARKMW
jgi:riboflavin kinase/FMN adenylyltransferase